MTPIYYVVVKVLTNQWMLNVQKIIKVVESDLSHVLDNSLYMEHVAPLFENSGEQYSALIIYREPDNPFKDFSKE